jgi:hypothetical protein
MEWRRVEEAAAPIGRPVLVRTAEDTEPLVAFLSADGIWYAGGALVQNSTTLLGAAPTEWCEPDGVEQL